LIVEIDKLLLEYSPKSLVFHLSISLIFGIILDRGLHSSLDCVHLGNDILKGLWVERGGKLDKSKKWVRIFDALDLLHQCCSLDWGSRWVVGLDLLKITNDGSDSGKRGSGGRLSGLESKFVLLSLVVQLGNLVSNTINIPLNLLNLSFEDSNLSGEVGEVSISLISGSFSSIHGQKEAGDLRFQSGLGLTVHGGLSSFIRDQVIPNFS
jgi:hypothetical protein